MDAAANTSRAPMASAAEVEGCDSSNTGVVQVEGYAPLAKGHILQHPRLTDLAAHYQETPARVGCC